MIDPAMNIAELLPYVLVMFGVVFLVANIRAGIDLVRYLRRRRQALLTWPGRKPPYYGLALALGVTLGLLLVVKFLFLERQAWQFFGEGMMFLYYGYAVPLTARIGRGFYADGIWAENGFMPYAQIGGIAWREGEQVTLLLVSRLRQMARPLVVPTEQYGAVRRLLRDKVKTHDIQFSGHDLGLGYDQQNDI
jgi:hypothetical protein